MYFGNNSNQPTQVVGGSKTKTLLATITSSQNWTCPEGITSIDIFLVGGGAGGNSGGAGTSEAKKMNCGGAGGDGGKGLFIQNIEVIPNQQYSVIIGAGGNGGAAPVVASGANSGNVGLSGGDTIFNNQYTAKGGTGATNTAYVCMTAPNGNGGKGGQGGRPGYYGGNIMPSYYLFVENLSNSDEISELSYQFATIDLSTETISSNSFGCINPYNFTMYGIGGTGGGGVANDGSENETQRAYAVLNSAVVPEGSSAHGSTPENPPSNAYGFGGNGGGASYGYTNKTIAGANGMSGVCFIYG